MFATKEDWKEIWFAMNGNGRILCFFLYLPLALPFCNRSSVTKKDESTA